MVNTVVQGSHTARLPKVAELGEYLFVRHVNPNPLTAWEPFVTIWVCTGHGGLLGNVAEWQQFQLGETQPGETEDAATFPMVQHSRTAKLPKTAAFGTSGLVEHVNHNPITAWERFVTAWVCTGTFSLSPTAQWQQVMMGEAQAGELDERPTTIPWIQHARTAKLPKEGTLGETLGIKHVSAEPLDEWEPFVTAWACTGFFPLSPYAQWQQVLLGDVQLGE
ncbi:hypothetical protein ACIP4S_33220 [Streptomyces chartreusis]|uniref:hypothetical protein n=1 Tax=Streptomyces chartreusis TaxID=1969 RepID=UPI003828785A